MTGSSFIFSLPPWLPPIWCVFSVLSFVGWGSLLARFFKIRADWGLKGVWGAAFSLMVFSCILCALRFPLLNMIYCWMGLGGVLFVAFLIRPSESYSTALKRDRLFIVPLLILILVVGIQILLAEGEIRLNLFDDSIAYVPFVRSLLELGSFNDPFSLRRGAAYGGQTILLALTYPGFGIEHANLLESGVLLLLLIMLLVGWIPSKKRGAQLWIWLLIPIAITEYPTINLASQLSPTLFLLGIVRTIDLFRKGEKKCSSWSEGAVLAMTASAFVSLRATFLVLAGILLFLDPMLETHSFKKGFRQGAKTWICFFVFLIPWAVSLYQAIGTPYYPLFSGNIIALDGSMRNASEPFGSLARFGFGFWLSNLIVLVLFPITSWKFVKTRVGGVSASYIACFLTAILLTASLPKFPRTELDRYHHAYLLACCILFIRSVMDDEQAGDFLSRAFRFSAIGSALIFIISGTLWISDLPWRLKAAVSSLEDSTQLKSMKLAEERYLSLQSHLPEKSVILSATDQPFYFNYKRNKIYHLDIPGHAAPGGVMPSLSSGVELDRYLTENGIEYLVYSRPEKSAGMYSLQKWEGHMHENRTDYHASWSKQFLSFFSYVSEASKRNEVVYRDDFNTVIKLKKSP